MARGSCRIPASRTVLAAVAAQRFEAELEATQGGGAVVVVPYTHRKEDVRRITDA